MKIQWQQDEVFFGAYTYVADVGDIELVVWREEPGVWGWYARHDTNSGTKAYDAFDCERSVGAAKAAAAAWWRAHGRISTVRRVVWGHKQTFLAGTGADPAPRPALVEQPVEARQEIAKVAADSAELIALLREAADTLADLKRRCGIAIIGRGSCIESRVRWAIAKAEG